MSKPPTEVREYRDIQDTDPDLVQVLKKIRYDLTDLQVKVSEAMRMANSLNLQAPVSYDCPQCGLQFRSSYKLAAHIHNSHGGPIPEQDLAIEAIAQDPLPDAEHREAVRKAAERDAA